MRRQLHAFTGIFMLCLGGVGSAGTAEWHPPVVGQHLPAEQLLALKRADLDGPLLSNPRNPPTFDSEETTAKNPLLHSLYFDKSTVPTDLKVTDVRSVPVTDAQADQIAKE